MLSPALDDIATAAEWFESQRRGLGREFWQAVDSVLDRIETRPLEFGRSDFATAQLNLRFAVVSKFN